MNLDRIEIESACSDPVRLARALLKQLPELDGRVPIHQIALALDIVSIEVAELGHFLNEGHAPIGSAGVDCMTRDMATRFDISRAAATRRYVGLHDARLAGVFSTDGRIRYIDKPESFPSTRLWSGDPVGPLPARRRHSTW